MDRVGFLAVREVYLRSRRVDEARTAIVGLDLPGMGVMIRSLMESEGKRYPSGPRHLARLDVLERQAAEVLQQPERLAAWLAAADSLRCEALIADNPLLQSTSWCSSSG